MPNFFPPDCQDLISKILVLNPTQRITISEMKMHPCFRKDIPFEYIMPRPLPLPSFKDPIDPSTIPPEILDVLHKIGYNDDKELRDDFLTDQHSMAKVFFFMMTSRVALDQIDWSQSVTMGDFTDANEEIMLNPSNTAYVGFNRDPFGRKQSISSSQSIELSTSLAFSPEWAMPPTEPMNFAQVSEIVSHMDITHTILAIQILMRSLEMQWFHPDDFTIISRQESLGLYVVFQCSYSNQGETPQTRLQIQLCHGTIESFGVVCRGAEELLTIQQKQATE